MGVCAFTGIASAKDKVAVKPYALDYCIFSDDKLGSMGKTQVIVYEGQEIKVCCKDCVKDFKKDPKAGLAKYHEAVRKAGKK